MKRFIILFFLYLTLGCNKASIIEVDPHPSIVQEASFVNAFLYARGMTNSYVIYEKLSIGDCLRDQSEEVFLGFSEHLIREVQQHNKRLVEAVRDFCNNNREINTIDIFGTLSYKNFIITEKQFNKLFETNRRKGWDKFHKLYPHSFGLITLSRPGFSKDGNFAVIYMGHEVDGRVGSGGIYVYEKKGDKWTDTDIYIACYWKP